MRRSDTDANSLNGIVIGVFLCMDEGYPGVVFAGNTSEQAIRARTTITLSSSDVGAEVALMFEDGDPLKPIIIGRLLRPGPPPPGPESPQAVEAEVDGERVEITGKEQVVLRCGKASITLTRAGKIILRGAYISSRSSGVNRIKGASVQLN